MFKKILVAAVEQSGAQMAAAEKLRLLDSCCEVERFHLESVRPGDVLDHLLHHAVETRADLLVLGARRHVMASRAAMLAPCSVLMIPDDSVLDLDRIVAPVDFSSSSGDALKFAFALAESAGGTCRALAVECDDDPWLDWPERPGELENHLDDFIASHAGPRNRGRRLVEPLTRSTTAMTNAGLSFPHGIEGANISFTIVEAARRERATLLVMGTRGRSRSAAMLLGSVTEKTIQLSQIPLLAFKKPGETLGLLEGVLERFRSKQPSLMTT